VLEATISLFASGGLPTWVFTQAGSPPAFVGGEFHNREVLLINDEGTFPGVFGSLSSASSSALFSPRLMSNNLCQLRAFAVFFASVFLPAALVQSG